MRCRCGDTAAEAAFVCSHAGSQQPRALLSSTNIALAVRRERGPNGRSALRPSSSTFMTVKVASVKHRSSIGPAPSAHRGSPRRFNPDSGCLPRSRKCSLDSSFALEGCPPSAVGGSWKQPPATMTLGPKRSSAPIVGSLNRLNRRFSGERQLLGFDLDCVQAYPMEDLGRTQGGAMLLQQVLARNNGTMRGTACPAAKPCTNPSRRRISLDGSPRSRIQHNDVRSAFDVPRS